LHAEDAADERALARAIGADDGDDLARLDVERDIVERLGIAIEEIEVAHFQHRLTPPRAWGCRDSIAALADRATRSRACLRRSSAHDVARRYDARAPSPRA